MTFLVLAALLFPGPQFSLPSIARQSAGERRVASASTAPEQQHEPIEGTRISLVRPAGFAPAERFPGFEEAATGSSVMVTEMAAPFSEVAAGLTEESLRSRGVELQSRHSVEVAGHAGLLLRLRQTLAPREATETRTVLKWMVVFGDEAEMVMILATFPESLESEQSERLRATVLGAKWERGREVDPYSGLTFSVEPGATLRLADRMQNMLLYTREGSFPVESEDEPLFIVGPAVAEVGVADRKQFAEARIAQTSDSQILSVESNREISLDGLSGYETVARALDVRSDAPMLIYQVILFERETYYIMQGLVGAERRGEYLAEFKRMAHSFRRK